MTMINTEKGNFSATGHGCPEFLVVPLSGIHQTPHCLESFPGFTKHRRDTEPAHMIMTTMTMMMTAVGKLVERRQMI